MSSTASMENGHDEHGPGYSAATTLRVEPAAAAARLPTLFQQPSMDVIYASNTECSVSDPNRSNFGVMDSYLTFEDPHLESQFQQFYFSQTRPSVRQAMMIGVAVWLLFIIADITKNQEGLRNDFTLTVGIRIASTLVGVICILLTYADLFRKYSTHVLVVAIVTCGASQVTFGVIEDDALDPTYSGLILLLSSITGTFFGLRFWAACACNWILFTTYAVVVGLTRTAKDGDKDSSNDWGKLILTLFILGVGNVIFLFISYYREARIRLGYVVSLKLKKEEARSFRLLQRMMPTSVIKELRSGAIMVHKEHTKVSVLFSHIHQFDDLVARLKAPQLVKLLNELFSLFDTLTDQWGVYKVETIGDVYMLSAGVPTAVNKHAHALCDVALAMKKACSATQFLRKYGSEVALQIGINSGSVIAGVVGQKYPRYRLMGDTVNLASRMSTTNCRANAIQLSPYTYRLVRRAFVVMDRGRMEVKGRGKMHVYELESRLGGLAGRPGTHTRRGSAPEALKDLLKAAQPAAAADKGRSIGALWIRKMRSTPNLQLPEHSISRAQSMGIRVRRTVSSRVTRPLAPGLSVRSVADFRITKVRRPKKPSSRATRLRRWATSHHRSKVGPKEHSGSRSVGSSPVPARRTLSLREPALDAPRLSLPAPKASLGVPRRPREAANSGDASPALSPADAQDTRQPAADSNQHAPPSPSVSGSAASSAAPSRSSSRAKRITTIQRLSATLAEAQAEEERNRFPASIQSAINGRTLNFDAFPLLELDFRDTLFENFRGLNRRGVGCLCAALLLLGAFEIVQYQDSDRTALAWSLIFLCLSLALGAGLVFLSTTRYYTPDRMQWVTSIVVGAISVMLIETTMLYELHDEVWGVGLTLIMLSLTSMAFGLRFLHVLATTAGILVAYCALALIHHGSLPLVIWFLLAGNALYSQAAYANELQNRADFLSLRKQQDEEERTSTLLHNMLPAVILQEIQQRDSIAHDFADSSVLFCDIVQFTRMAASIDTKDLVAVLNIIFSTFDKLTTKYGVYKVETIGDAYLVCSGVVEDGQLVHDDPTHTHRLLDFALDMQHATKGFVAPDNKPIVLRAGVHTGPVIAGVVGRKMPRFHLFGETYTLSELFEANGIPGRVVISNRTKEKVDGDFDVVAAPEIPFGGRQLSKWVLVGRHGEIDIDEEEEDFLRPPAHVFSLRPTNSESMMQMSDSFSRMDSRTYERKTRSPSSVVVNRASRTQTLSGDHGLSDSSRQQPPVLIHSSGDASVAAASLPNVPVDS